MNTNVLTITRSSSGRQLDQSRVSAVKALAVSTITRSGKNISVSTPNEGGQPFVIKSTERASYVRCAQEANVILQFLGAPNAENGDKQLYVIRVAQAPERKNSVWPASAPAPAAAESASASAVAPADQAGETAGETAPAPAPVNEGSDTASDIV